MRRSSLTVAALVGMLAGISANAENGVSADRISFGQIVSLDGPNAEMGRAVKLGLEAAFFQANTAGGIAGHKLGLTAVDDGYEPSRSLDAAKTLLADDKIFALIGGVGTPTTVAILPVAADAKVPVIGPVTGSGALRDPFRANVINVRASYNDETEMMVDHLTADLGLKHIAVFFQNDAYGQAGVGGVARALAKRNLEVAARGTYERNTVDVAAALDTIKAASPDAVIMVGTYKPTAAFVQAAHKSGLAVPMVSVSFVDANALARALGPEAAGIIVTEVVPGPEATEIPLVAQYRQALAEYGKANGTQALPSNQPSFSSLEGYLVGAVAIKALHEIKGEITRDAFLDAFHNGSGFDIGGIKLSYGPTSNVGSSQVFLTVAQPDGSFKLVTHLTKSAAGVETPKAGGQPG